MWWEVYHKFYLRKASFGKAHRKKNLGMWPLWAKFSLERNLHRHLKDIHEVEVNSFKCDLCEITFKRNNNLLQHERDVHNINKHLLILKGVNDTNEIFECFQCGKGFKLKTQLKQHLDTVHSQEVDRYICEICKKGCYRKDNLKTHKKIHK